MLCADVPKYRYNMCCVIFSIFLRLCDCPDRTHGSPFLYVFFLSICDAYF